MLVDRNRVILAPESNVPGAGDCRMAYPAFRPEVVSVSGIASSGTTAASYASSALSTLNALGSLTVTYPAAGARETPANGVTLPATIWAQPVVHSVASGVTFNEAINSSELSWATAAAAGGVALQQDGFLEQFGFFPSGPAGIASVLLSGDAWTGGDAGALAVTGRAGFGRFHAFFGNTDNLTAPWGYGWRGMVLDPGTYSWTVGTAGPETGVRLWRWVTVMLPVDLTNVDGDYAIEVVDSCRGK